MVDRIIYEDKGLGLKVLEWMWIKEDGEGQGEFRVATLIGEWGFSWNIDIDYKDRLELRLTSQHYYPPIDEVDSSIIKKVRQALIKEYGLPLELGEENDCENKTLVRA